MTISSRTPEGLPNRCPVCGAEVKLEPSSPARDACCPNCGSLLWYDDDPLARRPLPARGGRWQEMVERFPLPMVLAMLVCDDAEMRQWAACEAMMRGLEERGTDKQLIAVLVCLDASLRGRAARALAQRHPDAAEEIETCISRLQSHYAFRWMDAAAEIRLMLLR